MPGLVSYTQSLAVPTATGSNIDINRELGLTQAKLLFDQRTKALVHPDAYKNDRNEQFDKMTAAVAKTYEETTLVFSFVETALLELEKSR